MRRSVLGGGLCAALLAPSLALGAAPVTFEALRNGRRIGEQSTTIERQGDERVVRTTAVFVVKIGPLTAYRYRHDAVEHWEGDRFMRLETRTNQNGKALRTSAQREAEGVGIVDAAGRRVRAAARAAPFSHWNQEIAGRPLFNPQDGKLLRVSASAPQPASILLANGRSIPGVRISFRGDAEIDDFYDAQGVWAGLVGALEDRSRLEYRRL